MNTFKYLFRNRIDNHVANDNAYLMDLPNKEQKIITTLFLKQLPDSERSEYIHDSFDSLYEKTASFVMEMLENENDNIDPLAEMQDELILKLIDMCQDPIQEYFDQQNDSRLLDQESVRYSLGIKNPPTPFEQDCADRARDMWLTLFPTKVY
jgi:hypothetical protein